ncbi:MAG: hypothetical protein AMXMBFR79_00720 [Chitinophagaceae bacterium]|nr:hypothetical protein [Chitinophagaceae bacterium]
MNFKKLNSNLKTLIIMHTAMLMAQILLAAIVYYINHNNTSDLDNDFSRKIQMIITGIAVFSVVAALFLFKKNIEKLKNIQALNEKILKYRQASIIKFALLEFATFVAIIGYFVTLGTSFLVLAAVLIAFFALQKPTVLAMTNYLEVRENDLME